MKEPIMTQQREIAIFGGSFDPPTVVHEAIIDTLLSIPLFDEVWVMPSGLREDKPHTTQVSHRLAMLTTMKSEAFGGTEKLHISDFELNLQQPTETCNTVEALQKTYPDTKFWFVFGADSVGTMHLWRDGEQLLARLPIIIVPRHGYALPTAVKHAYVLPNLPIYQQDISSTKVRQRVVSGNPVDSLVSRSISRFIRQQKLYGPVV